MPPVIRFAQFTLDTQTGELTQGGDRVLLPDQIFRLLMMLIRERGRVVSRETLRQELWSRNTFVEFEPGLHAAVKRLREVLGDTAASPRFIETLPRRGYRFVAHVEDVADPAQPLAVHAPVEPSASRGRRLLLGALAVGAAAGVVIVALVAAARQSTPDDPTRPSGSAMRRLTNLGTVIAASQSPDERDLAYIRRDGTRESLWRRQGQDGEPALLVGPADGSFVSLTYGPGGFVYYTFFSPDRTKIALFRVAPGATPEMVLEGSGPIAFSPDGSRYAHIHNLSLALGESRVLVTETATGVTRVLSVRHAPTSFVMFKPAWSPDGARLAVFGASDEKPGRHEILAVELGSGAVSMIADVALAQIAGVLWPAGGRDVIAAGREGRATPQRLWSVSTATGAMRPLTDDLNDYSLVGMAEHEALVLAVRLESTRSLWVADASAPDRPTRLAEDAGSLHGYDEVAWTPDKHVIYTLAESGNADIWTLDPATRQRRRLTADPADDYQPAVSPDGATVVFGSTRSGRPGLWSMARDGSAPRRLTAGGDMRPSFSPDGRWVAFQRSGVETTPWMVCRVWLDTGKVEQVAPPQTMRPAVSPDGRFVAHYWMTPDRWVLAVTPAGGGMTTTIFPIGPTHNERTVRWSPDGRALAFIDDQGGAANLWLQPLDRRPPRRLTSFTEGRIASFDWSRDGSRLAWMRVHEVSDVVGIAR